MKKYLPNILFLSVFSATLMSMDPPSVPYNQKITNEFAKYLHEEISFALIFSLNDQEAIKQKRLKKIKKYINKKADPVPSTKATYSDAPSVNYAAILYALRYGDKELLQITAKSKNFNPNYSYSIYSIKQRILNVEYACKHQQIEIAKELVSLGADKNIALLAAVKHQLPTLITWLVRNGADINTHAQFLQQGEMNVLLLVCATSFRSLDYRAEELAIIDELIRLGAYPQDDHVVPRNSALLSKIIQAKNLQLFNTEQFIFMSSEHLHQLLPWISPLIFKGENIIFAALRCRNEDLLYALLKDLKSKEQLGPLINAQSPLGLTPMMLANHIGLPALKTALMAFGASLDENL